MKIFRMLMGQPKRNPHVKLDGLLNEAEHPDLNDSGQFIASGLRAARGTSAIHRRTILTDLASVLDCEPDELGFLFLDPVVAANDSDPVIMPDFRSALRGEARALSH